MRRVCFLLCLLCAAGVLAADVGEKPRRSAVFALGSFWKAEAAFGCLKGVVRTTAGYSGGSKLDPDYHFIGDHAEAVEVEYNPLVLSYQQLLDVFWASHDPTQVFGQGPDVGDQYRSIILTNNSTERSLAEASRGLEQSKYKEALVQTTVEPLTMFYQAEAEHQKFELRRRPHLRQLLGDMREDSFARCRRATKLNSYAAGTCSRHMNKLIQAKVQPLLKAIPHLHLSFDY